jgi:hypothetical protein
MYVFLFYIDELSIKRKNERFWSVHRVLNKDMRVLSKKNFKNGMATILCVY